MTDDRPRINADPAQATALVETFEETGLRVRLVKHLIGVKRSQSYTRYYLAERLGGNPADMGWEAQAVMWVPPTYWARCSTVRAMHRS